MNTGTVKWFDSEKGYGFIQQDGGGDDLFVHYSAIISDSTRKSLMDGQRVTFDAVPDAKNPNRMCAANVQAA